MSDQPQCWSGISSEHFSKIIILTAWKEIVYFMPIKGLRSQGIIGLPFAGHHLSELLQSKIVQTHGILKHNLQ